MLTRDDIEPLSFGEEAEASSLFVGVARVSLLSFAQLRTVHCPSASTSNFGSKSVSPSTRSGVSQEVPPAVEQGSQIGHTFRPLSDNAFQADEGPGPG
jgi:hypothetical protein